jgi:Ni,Fe-hydrogenase I cytochrome b subunit
MLDLINFIGVAIAFNLLFFLYASSKMKNKWNPVQTTAFAFLFSVPLAILVTCVYTITLAYAVYLGAGEEWVWEYLEHNTAQD